MTVQSLMRLCADLGIELALKGDNNDRLVVDAPKGALTEPLRQALTEHKAALISILKNRTQPANTAFSFSERKEDQPDATACAAKSFNALPSAEAVSTSGNQLQRSDAEVKKLLSGMAYDANTIDANDLGTRQLISAQLVAAISSRNPLEADCARRGFMSHGYFDDATRQLRTADLPTDRATAARKLGIVADSKATPHLVAALKDSAAEVRRAATESLGQIGDPEAIPALQDLLTRESNAQLPEAVVRHALNSIAVTQAKRLPTSQASSPRTTEEPSVKAEPPKVKREIFADYLSSFERRETLNVASPGAETGNSLAASVDRLVLEEESLRQVAHDVDQNRLNAEAARRLAEEEARIKAEYEAQARVEIEARMRAEEDNRRRQLADAARQQAEEEVRNRLEQEARVKVEAEARKRVEEEQRFRLEAETLRRAAEELAQKRAEASAARLRAEEEDERRRAQEEARQRAIEAARLRAEEEARILAEEEAHRVAEEQVRRRVEEEIRRREEEEARQRAEEEARQRREDEERNRIEEARLMAERETLLQVAAELARRRSEVEEARKQAENEARLLVEVQERARVEEESRRHMEIERQRLELEARRQADAELLQLAEMKAAEERHLAAEQARLKGEQEQRHIEELNSMWMAAEQESKQRTEIEQRIKAEILALNQAEEEQRLRIEAELQRRSETEARLKSAAEQAEKDAAQAAAAIRAKREEEARQREQLEAQLQEEQKRLDAEFQAREEARRLAEETRNKADEEARRRVEVEAQLQEEKARLQSQQEASAKAEEEARELANKARQNAEEEARRRVELEARLKEEEARLQSEQEARVKAEAEAYRLAEETRLRAEAAAASRAQVEARLREEEARLQAEEQARATAEAEASRLAQEASARAEAEAQRVAKVQTNLKEQARVQTERDMQDREPQAQGFAEVGGSNEDVQSLTMPEVDAVVAPEVHDQLFEFTAPSIQTEDVSWVEAVIQEDDKVLDALPVVDDSAYSATETLTELTLEPAKAIDVVLAEKGIASTEDDAGIPSEILNRLSSAQPAERAEGLAEVVAIGGDDAFRCICKAFDDQVVEVRNAAARALFNLQADRAATFTRALREGTPERRRKIGQALAGSGLAGDAVGNLTGESREKTYDAFSLLFLMAKAGEVQPLMQAIEDYPNVEVRIAVVKLLALSGQPEIIPAFRRLAVRGSLPSEVRSAVMEAIYQISSQAREHAPSAA